MFFFYPNFFLLLYNDTCWKFFSWDIFLFEYFLWRQLTSISINDKHNYESLLFCSCLHLHRVISNIMNCCDYVLCICICIIVCIMYYVYVLYVVILAQQIIVEFCLHCQFATLFVPSEPFNILEEFDQLYFIFPKHLLRESSKTETVSFSV